MLKLALIGSDTNGSLSPKLMSYFARKVGISVSYALVNLPNDCSDETLKDAIKQYDGVNITSPFKKRVGAFYGLPSVNVINNKGLACSTDGFGTVMALAHYGYDVEGKNLLILGAGGSAYSAASALRYENANIRIINRTISTAEQMAKQLNLTPWKGDKADGILSFLPPEVTISPEIKQLIPTAEFCFDANYKRSSLLLKLATEADVGAIDGLTMLFYQGVASFGLFAGKSLHPGKIYLWHKEFIDEITNS